MEKPDEEISRAVLFDAKTQHDELIQFVSMIQRFSGALSQVIDPVQACTDFVRIIIEETGIESSSIFLFDEMSNNIHLVAAFSLSDQLKMNTEYHGRNRFLLLEREAASRVFDSQHSVFVEGFLTDQNGEVEHSDLGPLCLASVPLQDQGVLNVRLRHPHEFTLPTKRNWEMIGTVIGRFLISIKATTQKASQKSQNGTVNNAGPKSPGLRPPQLSCSPFAEQILERLPQGICTLDTQGRIINYNNSFEVMHGKGTLEFVGLSPAVFFKEPMHFKELLHTTAASEPGSIQKTDVQLVNSVGETYFADIYLTRLQDRSGMTSGYILVMDDVTKKKAFFDKLVQSEKFAVLGTMAGGVSHDFNNLLMTILGNIQLILPQIEDEEIRRRLQCVEKAVSDGSNTVRRLQRFTHREPESKLTSYVVDVAEAVRDVVELTRPRWKDFMERSGHSIDLQLELAPNCFAAINASDLREVLTNLLLNAVDAMPLGGTVTFRSRCHGERVILEILDTGIGMAKETAEKIFDPFFTTKGVGNSGLGLSVCWRLIGSCGGDIRVRSKPGKGTTFVIELIKAERASITMPDTVLNAFSSCRLLLVEDDLHILNLLRDMLRLKGHKVMSTADGAEALKLIDTHDFDLVLTDLGMPSVSGWEIARRTKAKNPKTPVIMITGWGAQYEDEDLAARGVDLMLAKPLSWGEMMRSIEKLLLGSQSSNASQ
ncbi:MAG: ATP-binding protein [Syntrophobacteraceae bacterium]